MQSAAINKIIIGDVGSGKTIIAHILGLVYLNGLNNGQVVMIAPTEILARQHYKNLLLLPIADRINTILLTQKEILLNGEKTTKKKLQVIIKSSKSSKIFWVGTQALLHNEVVKADLVLADEQHRFGVNQRKFLAKHGAHYVSFTATPIPRSLALTLYADLEPLFLEKLNSRKEIKTSIISFAVWQEKFVEIIKEHIKNGQKVFVVCPAVEDNEADSKIWSVAKTYRFLTEEFQDKVLYTHGKEAQKQKTMADFAQDSSKQILVSTTVVEVGVDVSEATLMVVLNAERFGLAALHQIRGRVGRNEYAHNQCILVSDMWRSERLQIMRETNDGFKIAQKDLEIRGGGEMFGKSQSGYDSLVEKIYELGQESYVVLQKEVAQINLDNPELERLKKYVEKRASEVWEE